MKTNYWTISDTILAKKMNEEGRSARDIGEALNRSRNSVIGWFHRAGISLDKAKLGKVAKPVKKRMIRIPSPPKPPAIKAEPFKPRLFFDAAGKPIKQPSTEKNVSFMKLKNMMCHSVVGDPKGVDTIYCGEPTVKATSSWCAYHHSIYYGYRKEHVEGKSKQGNVGLFNQLRAGR